MEEKFGRKDSNSSDSDDDGNDEGGDGGDAGAVGASTVGASAAGTTGASSAGDDEEDMDSDDNQPEPGYEFYLDERGETTAARRKKKAKKKICSSSVQQSVPQQEPTQEAEMNPNLGFTADEAADMVSSHPRSSEPNPVVTSAPETPSVTPQEPAPSIASTIYATTSQPTSERRQSQIDRQSTVINVTRSDTIKQQLQINTLNSTVECQQAEITCQQEEIEQLKAETECLKNADAERELQLQQMRVADNTRGIDMNRMKERRSELQRLAEALKEKHNYMKKWYNSRNTTIVDGVKRITEGFEFVRRCVNILWGDRCKQQEVLQQRDHDSEDPGNPDPSATSEQPPATTSSQLIVFKPSQLGSSQGTSSGAIEEQQQLESSSYIESSMTEVIEEGEFVADLSHEQLLALNEMKTVEDSMIDQMSIEPETVDTENIEEMVSEGETSKSTYVHADGMEFDPFDEEWMKENQEDIDEQLKNRTSSDNPTDSFQEWRKRFLSKVEKPTPPEAQVDFLQFEKVKPHGKILSWMFVKEIH
ncbi:hypothetical protein Hanom_Chr12g01118051 [Helianthus anomalus]